MKSSEKPDPVIVAPLPVVTVLSTCRHPSNCH